MKLLWKEKVYGWWSVTGLIGKDANWFLGFSSKPPSPAQPLPPTTDPRTRGVTAFQPLSPAHVADPRGPEFTRINQHDAIVHPAGVKAPAPMSADLAQRIAAALECGVLWTHASEAHSRVQQALADFNEWRAAGVEGTPK